MLRAILEELRGGQLIIATIASHAREGYFAGYCSTSDELGVIRPELTAALKGSIMWLE